MKKFFMMMAVAITVCLSMNSCFTVGNADEWGTVSALKDNGSELEWSVNMAAFKVTYYFGYKGDSITYHKEEWTFGSTLVANAYYKELTAEEKANCTLSGKTIKYDYPIEEGDILTTEGVRELYQGMKEGIGLPEE